MRGVSAALLVAALVAACGGDGTSSQPDESIPATSSVRPNSTADEEPPSHRAVLHPDGVGEVDFGTPAEDAIAGLTELLGPPDRVEPIEPVGDGCVELAGWLDCVRELLIVEEGQLATWEELGLDVAFVDASGDRSSPLSTLWFGHWNATIASTADRLTTSEGIHPGMTVAELKEAVPSVGFGYNEGLLDSFYTGNEADGGYWGRLDWDPSTPDTELFDIAAVQTALNAHGADLVVDSIWGPRSEAAWVTFLQQQQIAPAAPSGFPWLVPEIGDALGLPPDEVTIATIQPRQWNLASAPTATVPATTAPRSALIAVAISTEGETWSLFPADHHVTVTNPGTELLSAVTVIALGDVFASSVNGPTVVVGNADDMLDPDEEWRFQAQSQAPGTATVEVAATTPNGDTVRGSASASTGIGRRPFQAAITPNTFNVASGANVEWVAEATNVSSRVLPYREATGGLWAGSSNTNSGAPITGASPMTLVNRGDDGDDSWDPGETWRWTYQAEVTVDGTFLSVDFVFNLPWGPVAGFQEVSSPLTVEPGPTTTDPETTVTSSTTTDPDATATTTTDPQP